MGSVSRCLAPQRIQVLHRVDADFARQIRRVGMPLSGRLHKVDLDQLAAPEQLHRVRVRPRGESNPPNSPHLPTELGQNSMDRGCSRIRCARTTRRVEIRQRPSRLIKRSVRDPKKDCG